MARSASTRVRWLRAPTSPAPSKTAMRASAPSILPKRYIEGREFNLALLEERGRARVLPMAEILFENWDEGTPRIVGYDAKWTSRQRGLYRHAAPLRAGDGRARACGATWRRSPSPAGTCSTSPATPGSTSASMPKASHTILEVNVNPCLNPDAGFAAAAAAAGLSYRDLIGRIIDAAPRALQAIA